MHFVRYKLMSPWMIENSCHAFSSTVKVSVWIISEIFLCNWQLKNHMLLNMTTKHCKPVGLFPLPMKRKGCHNRSWKWFYTGERKFSLVGARFAPVFCTFDKRSISLWLMYLWSIKAWWSAVKDFLLGFYFCVGKGEFGVRHHVVW